MDVKPVLAAIDKNFTASLERLKTLLRIPSISADPAHDGDCEKAARATCAILKEMGFAADLYDTPAHPVVIGRLDAKQAQGPLPRDPPGPLENAPV